MNHGTLLVVNFQVKSQVKPASLDVASDQVTRLSESLLHDRSGALSAYRASALNLAFLIGPMNRFDGPFLP
jgi:hypothetical protein